MDGTNKQWIEQMMERWLDGIYERRWMDGWMEQVMDGTKD